MPGNGLRSTWRQTANKWHLNLESYEIRRFYQLPPRRVRVGQPHCRETPLGGLLGVLRLRDTAGREVQRTTANRNRAVHRLRGGAAAKRARPLCRPRGLGAPGGMPCHEARQEHRARDAGRLPMAEAHARRDGRAGQLPGDNRHGTRVLRLVDEAADGLPPKQAAQKAAAVPAESGCGSCRSGRSGRHRLLLVPPAGSAGLHRDSQCHHQGNGRARPLGAGQPEHASGVGTLQATEHRARRERHRTTETRAANGHRALPHGSGQAASRATRPRVRQKQLPPVPARALRHQRCRADCVRGDLPVDVR